jgi:hypothetical protein
MLWSLPGMPDRPVQARRSGRWRAWLVEAAPADAGVDGPDADLAAGGGQPAQAAEKMRWESMAPAGAVSIEYQAAMIRDELEESAGWTTVGIARVLTEEQARTIAAATGG